jgi:hypothetical protein
MEGKPRDFAGVFKVQSFVSPSEQRWQHCEAECLRHFQVDHKPQFGCGDTNRLTGLNGVLCSNRVLI